MSNASSSRIASLDGWRGIAILLVLFDHMQGSLLYHTYWHTGYHGVTVFFVLSGFLITSKLIESPATLREFYTRRFFRLMPAAWVFLSFIVALDLAFGAHLTTMKDVSACLFFYRDFKGSDAVSGHFWSLSVEEKFYIVWPSLLLISGRQAKWFALAGALGCIAIRLAVWGNDPFTIHFSSPALWGGGIFVGCLAALMKPRLPRFAGVAALVVLVIAIAGNCEYLLPLEQGAIAVLLISALTDCPLTRLLALKPLAWLGRISYSVYIWQGLFIPFHKVWALLLIPVFAVASFYLIEEPCTRLGRTFSFRRPAQRIALLVRPIDQELRP